MTASSRPSERLSGALQRVMDLRAALQRDAGVGDPWRAVKAFQRERLAATYPDLLASERYRQACQFFLDELYGARDFRQRDRQALTVVPKLARMLPARAVEAMAMGVELDELSETLDARVARAVASLDGMPRQTGSPAGSPLSAATYALAYCQAGTPLERARQIDLVGQIGRMLEHLAGLRLIPGLLRLARGPAEAAGFGQLHGFLESGFAAFNRMGPASAFLETVRHRETVVMERLFAREVDPFRPVA
jgi:hypothetical protein